MTVGELIQILQHIEPEWPVEMICTECGKNRYGVEVDVRISEQHKIASISI